MVEKCSIGTEKCCLSFHVNRARCAQKIVRNADTAFIMGYVIWRHLK